MEISKIKEVPLHSVERSLEDCYNSEPIKNQSKKIDQIAKVLPKIQAEYSEVNLNRNGPRGPYANLTPYFQATAPALNKYGCFFYHYSTFINDKEFLRARILHDESGQWIESHARLIDHDDPDYASFKTKHKRYTMRDVLGIISDDSEDDDAAPTNAKKGSHSEKQITDKQLRFLKKLINGKTEIENSILQKWNLNSLEDLSIAEATTSIDKLVEITKK